MVNCRAPGCYMQLNSTFQLKQHEGLMHRTLISETVEKIILKIITTNSPVDLEKKTVYINGNRKVSYREVSKMNRESEEFKQVELIFANFIEKWFETHESNNVNDLLRIVKFNIK